MLAWSLALGVGELLAIHTPCVVSRMDSTLSTALNTYVKKTGQHKIEKCSREKLTTSVGLSNYSSRFSGRRRNPQISTISK